MEHADLSLPVLARESRGLPGWARWVHTYLSMLGLGSLCFFSVTGLTLNHPDWLLGAKRHAQTLAGTMDASWLARGGDEKAVDKLKVVEYLRRVHGLHGLVDDFRVEPTECSVVFKGPGSSADVSVERATGKYQGNLLSEGYVALINDLHKGRHTGPAWALVIDIVAVLLTLSAVSGIWLLLYVRRRRVSGFWIGIWGAALLWLVFVWGVS